MKTLSFLVMLFLASVAYSQDAKGDRTLAWQIDMTENANYDSAYMYGLNACMESVHLFYTWSGIEPTSGTFDANYLNSGLAIANLYYPAFNTKVELQLAPTNTVAKETPSDLMSVPFDSPIMIARFKSLLDTVFAYIPDLKLSALNLGNESDVFWGTNQSEYVAYKTFLDSIQPYAKQLYFNLHGEELKVGTTLTHAGLVDPATSAFCQTLNSDLDIVSVTYYPLNSDFTMKDPSVVTTDFSDVVGMYSDTAQPIYFVECGYSSSTSCNSTEQKQADFYANVFSAWDTHKENIKYITVFKSTDWSQAEVDQLSVYYGISTVPFKEYLRTLGVRTWQGNGSDKLAYQTILCELDARNWCSVSCPTADLEEETISSEIRMYPNPARNHVKIESELVIEKIELINGLGQIVGIGNAHFLDLNNVKSGVYSVRIVLVNGQQLIRQLVVLK